MNKEELLRKAREDNKELDEREMIHLKASATAGMLFGGALCLLINVVCHMVDSIDPLVQCSCWLIWIGMQTAAGIYKAVHIRKKSFIWGGILYSVLFLAALVIFVIELIGRKG